MSPPVKEKRLTGILHKPQKRLLIGTLTVIAVACLIILPVIAPNTNCIICYRIRGDPHIPPNTVETSATKG